MAERVCCSYQNVLSIQNRVCCLYRVSTTKQVDHDDQNQADIPVQRKACREFAERMGWTIVYEEQENGVSGFKVSANDRDKIQLIKEYAEQGKFDILLVFMFDRIGRRAEETPFVVEWLINHGIQVWSVNEGEQRIDTHGTCVKRKRTRYICYNKVRKRCPCSGPTGYTAHILDARVKAYLRELFAAVKCGGISTVTDDTKKQLAEKQAELLELTQQFEESQSQYELFKDRLLDSIQQADPKRQSMLTEVLDEAYERVVSLRKGVGILQAQVEGLSETVAESEKHAARIMEWANIFEVCSAETQKMIAGYMLKCVTVFQDYRMDIQTNDIGIAIPMLGTESTEQI